MLIEEIFAISTPANTHILQWTYTHFDICGSRITTHGIPLQRRLHLISQKMKEKCARKKLKKAKRNRKNNNIHEKWEPNFSVISSLLNRKKASTKKAAPTWKITTFSCCCKAKMGKWIICRLIQLNRLEEKLQSMENHSSPFAIEMYEWTDGEREREMERKGWKKHKKWTEKKRK